MSARQRARLSKLSQQQKKLSLPEVPPSRRKGSENIDINEEDEEEDEDEDEGESTRVTVRNAFAMISSSSEDEDEDELGCKGDDDDDNNNTPIVSSDQSSSMYEDAITSAELNPVNSTEKKQRGGKWRTKKSSKSVVSKTPATGKDTAEVVIKKALPDRSASTAASNEIAAATEDEDHKLLDAILLEQQQQIITRQQQQNSRIKAAYNDEIARSQLLFSVDAKALDLDAVQRRRFGGGIDELLGDALQQQQPQQQQHRGIARRPNNSFLGRKFLFGQPKDDWTKPPAYGLGGIGMIRAHQPAAAATTITAAASNAAGNNTSVDTSTAVAATVTWFQFDWSKEFEFLNSQYSLLEQSGDINLIIMFLAHFPYHPRAFLQLAAVFARTGRSDRAADVTRRVLYLFESAAMEAFKPSTGLCRLDPQQRENADFFEALFRHALYCAMQGSFATAADVSRLMLSLCPAPLLSTTAATTASAATATAVVAGEKSAPLLLMLDTFLAAASRYELLLDYCGIKGSDQFAFNGTASATATAVVDAEIERLKWHIDYGYDLDDFSQLPHTANSATTTTSTASDDTTTIAADSRKRAPTSLEFSFRSAYKIGHWKTSTTAAATATAVGDYSSSNSSSVDSDNERQFGLEALPNWWLSLALSTFFAEEAQSNRAHFNSSSQQQQQQHGEVIAATSAGAVFDCQCRGKKLSSLLLKAALLRWSFMLQPLLQQCDIQVGFFTTAAAAAWKPVLTHSLFAEATQRLQQLPTADSSTLGFNSNSSSGSSSSGSGGRSFIAIANAYAARSCALWKREEVLRWLLQCCTEVLGEISLLNGRFTLQNILEKQNILYAQLLAANSPITTHYSSLQLEDFLEELPRFPQDMDPIEPQLLDPHLFAGAARFQDFMDDTGRFLNPWLAAQQQQQQLQAGIGGVRRGGGGLAAGAGVAVMARRAERQLRQMWAAAVGGEGVEDDDNDDFHAANLPAVGNAFWQQQQHQEEAAARRDRSPRGIDLNLPLLQLFFATLLPWVHVSRPNQR